MNQKNNRRLSAAAEGKEALRLLREVVTELRRAPYPWPRAFDRAALFVAARPVHWLATQTPPRLQDGVHFDATGACRDDVTGEVVDPAMRMTLAGPVQRCEVRTVFRAGIWVVHKSRRRTGRTGRYALTHEPSGFQVDNTLTLAEARATATRLNAITSDVGRDCPFGERPPREVVAAIAEALVPSIDLRGTKVTP